MTPAELATLHARCFTTPRPWGEAEFAELLASRFCFLLIEPEGFVLGRVIAGEAELLTLAVAPEARRHGSGRKLVERFAETATQRGADAAFLEVSAENAPARALYAQAGWTESGRRKGYYRTPEGCHIDAVIMTWAPDRPGV
ncbi:GNAT family N-acetyltransferase [Sedimentimonas flavescens]|uniref:GNAT family N-acetyltransferase n=1 Tax=Sedimentimonas flavescens TaxID=2851012 RepID=A0ABT2ZU95_9RHOB|nr:GNAT family N-acetyltransferase [Sedimentimonas flavescens]MCT2539410.1 GNAT family N-acetyltransferase [Sedimentimonas flavescens]MCV2877310.1 GNAT family N-acetyltransferase [Sedimentimonas flavescens]